MLKPTLRQKHRYVAFEIECEREMGRDEVDAEVKNSILSLFGERGFSLAMPKMVIYEGEGMGKAKGLAVVRCSHTEVDNVKAALALVSSAGPSKCAFRVLRVSGTIKKLKMKLAQDGAGEGEGKREVLDGTCEAKLQA
ncbi:MAG: ribonuclease P protein component 2 [Candidatus Micrarchaeota archaeon]|nr:ribonuclease P protein component 2 [Candidatus Micrarchaeota archaeon]